MKDAIQQCIEESGDERKDKWLKFHQDHLRWMVKAKGSGQNHQAWEGGYYHHVQECFQIAKRMFTALVCAPFDWDRMPFTLGSALMVLYFHDIEKMWKHTCGLGEDWDKLKFLNELPERYGFGLTGREKHAIYYIHGEGEDYRKDKRVMGRLGAFCHAVDVLSARLWHDYPKIRQLPLVTEKS